MGKSNKKSSSSSKVASLVGTELSANKKKRKIENKAEKKKLLEPAEKSAPTDKKSKKKRKSTDDDDDDTASKDISAEDQKVASLVGSELSVNKKKRKIENKEEKKKLLESAEKSAPTDKKSKKKRNSTDDDGAPTDKKSKKKHKSTDDDGAPTDKKSKKKRKSTDDDDTASKDISAEDQKAEKPAKKLPESSEKSAPTAKKSSSEDSPSEDISANQKGTEIVVDESSRLHLYEHCWQKKILPKDSKTLFTRNIACPPGRKITQADFEKFFRKAGKVVNVQIKLFDHNEDFVELAEIEFESHDVAKRALKKRHMYQLFGTSVCLDVSREGSGPLYNMTDCTHERPVLSVVFGKDFISDNLHNKLEDIFKSCGEIDYIIATRDEDTYLSNGYAYVVFKDFESLPKAIDLDGTEFMGAPMKITRARVLVTSV